MQRPENQRAGAASSGSARQPAGARSASPIVAEPTASTRTSRRRRSSVPEPPVLVGLIDQWGRAAQERPGAARDRRVGLDGRAGERRAARPSSTWPSRPRSTRSTSSRPTTRSACASSRPTSAATEPTDYLDLVADRADRRAARERSRGAIREPRPRPRARRCTPSPRTSYDEHAGGLRPDAHQRRRAAHRRTQRGPAQQRPRRAARHAAGRQRGRDRASPVRVFPIAYGEDADLGDAQAHRRGHQRRRLRRHRPHDHRPRSSPRSSATSDHGVRRQACPST